MNDRTPTHRAARRVMYLGRQFEVGEAIPLGMTPALLAIGQGLIEPLETSAPATDDASAVAVDPALEALVDADDVDGLRSIAAERGVDLGNLRSARKIADEIARATAGT